MSDPSASPTSDPQQPAPSRGTASSAGAPRWLGPSLFALAVVVLGGNVFHVLGLAASGVTWTDGDSAYGVPGGDVSSLPPVLSRFVGGVTVMAVLLAPLLVAPIAVIAAWLLWSTWRHRSSVDISAVGTFVAAGALVVLLISWGDELWVWVLD